MAAAYAALVSLLTTLDQIQTHPLLSTYFKKYPNESLCKKIDFLVDFVESYSDSDSSGEAEDLVKRIAVAAREAEDIIEVRAADRVPAAESTRKGLRKLRKLKTIIVHRIRVAASTQQRHTFWPNLQRVIDDMDSIKDQIMKIKKETGNRKPTYGLASSSSSAPPANEVVESNSEAEDLVIRRMAVVALEDDEIIQVQPKDPIFYEHSPSLLPDMQIIKKDKDSINKKVIKAKDQETGSKTTNMVGFDGYLEQLLDQLTRHHCGRQILPIVGMGGIGKTTLARNVYDNLLIVEHFYVRAWVTVSQEFGMSDILLQALSCLGGSTSKTDRTDGQLGEELHKILYGQRYLIVLDDVWTVEALEKIMFFFPENNNGSRIIITTRQSVGYFGSSALAVDFLDSTNSWELFCEKTFPQQDCPPELVEIGKKIVVKCKGLPLAIVVVAGFLGKSPRTLEYWEEIAKDKSLILDSGEGNTASGILYLSYKHLPIWLKSCFLYLGLFPEDYPINVAKLIKLWIAEGFIKSNTDQSLEEIAMNYVKELVDRNLVLVGKLGVNKKLKTCLVHDVIRDLCLRIAEKENFYCVQRDIDGKRHIIVDQRTARLYNRESDTASLIKPLILYGQRAELSNSRLLRVWFSGGTILDPFQQVNLRLFIYLSYAFHVYQIPPSVSRLWSLQTVIVTGHERVTAPCELWEMPQLRHINITQSLRLPHPPSSDGAFVLQNLQTLATVEGLDLTDEVCKRIPNIKKLGILYHVYRYVQVCETSSSSYHLHNVGCFNKLESLRCSGYVYDGDLFRKLKFPSSLKKLTLKGCRLVWSDMAMIALLPHLQILKLLWCAVVGAEWNCVKVEFVCLKHLKISECGDLTKWNAHNSNFPVLETLSLESLSKLEEIPSDLGEVPTLEKIEMRACSYSAAFSAVKIVEEQESLGNFGLQLQIMFKYKSEEEKFWEEIEELDITRQNLLISCAKTY